MKFFARGGWLSRGTRTNRTFFFIVLAFQMASGGWKGGHLEGRRGKTLEPINRSQLPQKLKPYTISAFAFKLKGDGNVQSSMAVTNTLLVHPHPDPNTKGPTLLVSYLNCSKAEQRFVLW
ncbi:hypothetical protein GOODEAATRI_000158 [Goodea atripinnis]|uniref:Uncharacterized protein n=1 Tax=Goodea atripinnis TaxID=208336 RepID=A0ABV0PJK2_9TELE